MVSPLPFPEKFAAVTVPDALTLARLLKLPALSTLNTLVPFFWRLTRSAAEPAPVFGAFSPMYVPPLVAVLPPAIAPPN